MRPMDHQTGGPATDLDRLAQTLPSDEGGYDHVSPAVDNGRPAPGVSELVSQGAVVVAGGLVAVTVLAVPVRALLDSEAGIVEATDSLLGDTAGEWLFAIVSSLLLVALLVWLGGKVFARR